MRTGRLAGVATNQTVCRRRIRRHFFQPGFEIQLAPPSPVVKVVSQIHPPAAAFFLF
jgi:hypothetical protein